jgi:uncharacterized membrane protein
MNVYRLIKHLITPPWWVRRTFGAQTLHTIENTVRETETRHGGQVRVAIEAALDLGALVRGQSARERALEVFSNLRVWDTNENNGVLIYLLLADRDVEIVADRGIHQRVSPGTWEAVCQKMEAAFRAGEFEEGILAGVRAVSEELNRYFPRLGTKPNELPDAPTVL